MQQETNDTCQQGHDSFLLSSRGPKKKKRKIERERLSPILKGLLQIKLGTPKAKLIRILCDTGASTSIMEEELAKKLRVKTDSSMTWETGNGTMQTSKKCKVHFQLPEISPTMGIVTDVHLTKSLLSKYYIIIGRDLMRELKIKLDFEHDEIECGNEIRIPMKNLDCADQAEDLNYVMGIKEPQSAAEVVERVSQILDAKYAPISPEQILENSSHLTEEQKRALRPILEKHVKLFDGTLGKWKGITHHIELKDPKAQPIPCQPYPVLVKNKYTLMLEIERLCKIGVLRRVNNSE